jgi:hypothetical protein
MTVSVTLPDGRTEDYMRFGDAYIKQQDGTLDIMRAGARNPFSYAAGDWADVEGDERRWKKRRFWG